jgi:hypothetical protein
VAEDAVPRSEGARFTGASSVQRIVLTRPEGEANTGPVHVVRAEDSQLATLAGLDWRYLRRMAKQLRVTTRLASILSRR